jgi:hypothetical protein
MNEEITNIRGWVQDALDSAVEEGNRDGRGSNYDRGRIAGIISAYQHVMIETSPTAAWKKPMEEETKRNKKENIPEWVTTAIVDAIDELTTAFEREEGMSDFERGKAYSFIKVFKCSNARMLWLPKDVELYDSLNRWIWVITLRTSLTIAEVIKIYDFCDRNDLLKRHNTKEKIITLSLKGHTWQDITNLLKLEALKGGTWIHRGIWGRRRRDE